MGKQSHELLKLYVIEVQPLKREVSRLEIITKGQGGTSGVATC